MSIAQHLDRIALSGLISVAVAERTHGCCADKACSDKTCMELPAGKTCGDCSHIRHCEAFYAHSATDTSCDFFPRRFVERKGLAEQQRRVGEQA